MRKNMLRSVQQGSGPLVGFLTFENDSGEYSFDVSTISGIQDGDTGVLWLTGQVDTHTMPIGWSQRASSGGSYIATRYMSASDSSFSSSSYNSVCAGIVAIFRGYVDLNYAVQTNNGDSGDPDPPLSDGSVNSGELMVVTMGHDNQLYGSSVLAPSGYTLVTGHEHDSTTDFTVGMAYLELTSTGSENPGIFDGAPVNTDDWDAFTHTLHPPA